jgi:hypothetical protein
MLYVNLFLHTYRKKHMALVVARASFHDANREGRASQPASSTEYTNEPQKRRKYVFHNSSSAKINIMNFIKFIKKFISSSWRVTAYRWRGRGMHG